MPFAAEFEEALLDSNGVPEVPVGTVSTAPATAAGAVANPVKQGNPVNTAADSGSSSTIESRSFLGLWIWTMIVIYTVIHKLLLLNNRKCIHYVYNGFNRILNNIIVLNIYCVYNSILDESLFRWLSVSFLFCCFSSEFFNSSA